MSYIQDIRWGGDESYPSVYPADGSRRVQIILQKSQTWYIYFFEEISAAEFGFEIFSCTFSFICLSHDVLIFLGISVFFFFLSLNILVIFWLGNSIASVVSRFLVFIISIAHFSIPNSVRISWLYFPIVCKCVSSVFFPFPANIMLSN